MSNPDATTVTITLSEPDPTLPRRLAGRAGIVYDEEADTDYARQSAGSGPFTIAEFRPGVSITLRGDNAYWGSKPASSQITVRYFADETAMVDALRDGQIDMALPLDADTAQTLTEDPTLTVTTGESLNKTTLVFNNDADSIMSDSQMRQAVRYLVDTTAITQSTAEASQELGGPIGPLDPGYENLTDLFPYDLNKGASLASYFGTSYYGGGLRFVVSQRYAALVSTIASQIQQGGVPVNVEALDDAEYQVRIDSRQFDLTLQREEGSSPRPGTPTRSRSPDTPIRRRRSSTRRRWARRTSSRIWTGCTGSHAPSARTPPATGCTRAIRSWRPSRDSSDT